METREPDFPNLKEARRLDREAHVRRAMQAGLTREQAEKHADWELSERQDAEGYP